ncbi:hypothetical protein PTKIN_Ptkin02bG0065500 [Pterospermum kingtungense]
MFSLKNAPSTTSVLSTYTTFTATAMLVRGVITEVQAIASQLIPERLQTMVLSKLESLFSNPSSSQMTLLIDESDGMNELYEASQIYLQTKISTSMKRLRVSKSQRDNTISVAISKGETVTDTFEGIQLKWEMTIVESNENHLGKSEKRVTELTFQNECMEKVLNSCLPYVMGRSKTIKEENMVLKLYSIGNHYGDMEGPWGSTNLDHPATFDKIAMDPSLKKDLIEDLDRFVRRRDLYKRVGKVWKRGYLLYGPPGTGKSSLVAAMANYLKFNVYDLELASVYCNSDLRGLLTSTRNRSILVIEDIDCSIELQNRQAETNFEGYNQGNNSKN